MNRLYLLLIPVIGILTYSSFKIFGSNQSNLLEQYSPTHHNCSHDHHHNCSHIHHDFPIGEQHTQIPQTSPNGTHFCAYDEWEQLVRTQHPDLLPKQDSLDDILSNLLKRGKFSPLKSTYTVPVVVHVVHNGGAGNIPNAQVVDAIQHLNDAFENIGVYNPATGVDVDIEFCLAQQDPSGNATTGITNTVSTLTNLDMNTQDLSLKNLVRWTPTDYVNIWVVNEICSGANCGVAGYAYLPSAHGNNVDGIVMEATFMGSSTDNSKVLVHEMGHYFGLYHPFQSGCTNNDCTIDGDRVCDTPPDGTTAYTPCATPSNSCTTDEDDISVNNPFRPVANGGLGDQPDQIQNYMDYSQLVCYDRFTQGQKDRMHFFLTTTRASLLNSNACNSPCLNPTNIAFSASATNVVAGTNVAFTNTSTGTGTLSHDWLIDGISFATTTNASYTFNTPGTYTILLEIDNGDPNCLVTESIDITVTCQVESNFIASQTTAPQNNTIAFQSQSIGTITTYEWLVNGLTQGTNAVLNHLFTTPGLYTVELVVGNGLCTDTSDLEVTITSTNIDNYNPVGVATNIGSITNGTCSGTSCFQLTPDISVPQSGAVWNMMPLDLTNGFDFEFCVYLGNKDAAGADGICFVLQQDGISALGGNGGYLGYNGITPSIGFELDDFNNNAAFSDIANDHVSINYNGIGATAAAGPVDAIAGGGNIEDGNTHNFRITWHPRCETFQVYVDGDLRLSHTDDVINTVFGGNSTVFWGMTAGTWTQSNLHEFCVEHLAIYPFSDLGDTCVFSGYDITLNATTPLADSYTWSDGTTNPTLDINTPGTYWVDINTTTFCGTTHTYRDSIEVTQCSECSDKDQGNHWYFGNQAGVDFSSGTPVGVTNGAMVGGEGVASIADPTGNLLFYTNGNTVWDASHTTMLNGTGLAGSSISAQSSIIVPAPQGNGFYYIFTIPNWTDPVANLNLRYSIVDMSGNGGLGEITSKNILVHSGVAEQVSATYHANCTDIWIVTHERLNNNYVAHLLTPTGVSATPVISSVGANNTGGNRYGGLRFSHNGEQLCSTLGGSWALPTVTLLDFDNATGVISNPVVLADAAAFPKAYSSEFSPDNKLLYVCEFDGNQILQYNLNLPATAIRASAINIAQTSQTKSALQMGPDGKLYVAKRFNSFLGVIQQPNVLGLGCNYLDNGVDLLGRTATIGLPNFLPDLFEEDLYIAGPDTVCENAENVVFIASQQVCNTYGYQWSVSGNVSIRTVQDSMISVDFGNSGQATIYVQRTDLCGVYEDSLVVTIDCGGIFCAEDIPVLDLGPDTSACQNGLYSFNAGAGFVSYEWQDGYNDSIYTATTSGIYHVAAVTYCGDTLRDTVVLTIDTIGLVDFADTTLCSGDTLYYSVDPTYTVEWFPNVNIDCNTCSDVKIYPNTDQLYEIIVTDPSTGCITVDSLQVTMDTACIAQGVCSNKQANIWYFGVNAGLDFNSGTPTVLTDGQINTGEGCAVLSDVNGDLVFYTDGQIVYDRTHTIMPNGTGLLGHPSSTQSGVIVPHPGDPNLFYIFTVDFSSGSNGLRYSMVDLTLNGGLGDVTATKNVLLLSSSTEKIGVVKHCNQNDYWVIGHEWGSNNFHVYEVNAAGLNLTPNIQAVGTVHTGAIANKLGYMKPSADGSRLACAVFRSDLFELFDFNNSTGVISNPMVLSSPTWGDTYGVEFSADGNLMYGTTLEAPAKLIQLDLSSGNAATIQASATILAQNPNRYQYGALQMGPDGKIYVARRNITATQTFLATINSPSVLGVGANFQDQAITLTPGQSNLSLPTFVQSYLSEPVQLVGPDTVCLPSGPLTYTLNTNFSSSCALDTIIWQHTGANTVLIQNDSTLILDVTQAGQDTIIAEITEYCGTSLDTIILTVHPEGILDLGPDTTICENGVFAFNAGAGFASYEWQDGYNDSIYTATISGLYYVEAVTYCGDTLRDSVNLSIDTITLVPIPDTTICLGDTLHLSLDPAYSYQWLPNTDIDCNTCSTVQIYPNDTTEYTITATTSLGCAVLDTFELAVTSCAFETVIDTSLCAGVDLVYNGNIIDPPSVDTFMYMATNGQDSFVIINSYELDTFNIVIDTATCAGESIVYNGTTILAGTSQTFNLQTVSGCDSIVTVNVNSLDTFNIVIDTATCAGESIAYNGTTVLAGTSQTFNLQTVSGCDSIVTVNVGVLDTFNVVVDTLVCAYETVFINGANLSPGTSTTFILQAANGCDSIVTVNVLANPLLTTQQLDSLLVTTDIACFGNTNGSASYNITTGITPYTYNWSNSQTGNTATGLAAGAHAVTVTDGNGCTVSHNFNITTPDTLELVMDVDSVTCFGESDGAAYAIVTGGTTPYIYNWSNSQNTTDNTGLTAGAYAVTVTDANGCIVTGTVIVEQPIAMVVNILNFTDATCHDAADGTATADALGGTPPYTFEWDHGPLTDVVTGLDVGTYSVTVTDANGCTAFTNIFINEPSAIITQAQVYSNHNGADLSCPGVADGMAQVIASGGAGGFTYNWSGVTPQNTAIATDLLAGQYYVTVTDASGCAVVDSVTLEDPVPLAATEVHTDIFCHGQAVGQIIVTATPGTGTLGINGYEYSLQGLGVNIPFSTNNTFNGLAAGTYTVIVRDGNDCELPISIELTEPDPLTSSLSNITDALCNGSSDGAATVHILGGTLPYTYEWSNGETDSTAVALLAGNHEVTITDGNGCTLVTGVSIAQPLPITATMTSNDASCNGLSNGTATALPTGGIAPYTYLWDDSNAQTTATAINLNAGTYHVTITDANNCTSTETVQVGEPDILVVTIQGNDATCGGVDNGSAEATVTGGTAPYSYLWNDSNGQTTSTASNLGAGTYTVIITDANACTATATVTIAEPDPVTVQVTAQSDVSCHGDLDGTATVLGSGGIGSFTYAWSHGSTGNTVNNLEAGITYTVTATDANGCTTTTTVQVGTPDALTVDSTSITDVICYGASNGTAIIYVSGGTLPYTYAWSNNQSTQNASNLAAGVHNVTVTDANGCVIIEQISVGQPTTALAGLITRADALCSGEPTGQIAVTASGGTLPYTYAWSNNATTAVNNGVSAGNYTVTVTDASGCSIVLGGTVGDGGSINVNIISFSDVSCHAGADGTATASASGGTGSLNYVWSNAAGQTTATATGLSAGMYYVTVSDDNGCETVDSVMISEPNAITANLIITDATCFGANDGSIQLNNINTTVSLYEWSHAVIGANANPVTGLSAGTYSLTLTSIDGCRAFFDFEVGQPGSMEVTLYQVDPILCHGDSTASIEADVLGGNSNSGLTYLWSNGDTTFNNTWSGLSSGNYSVTVEDQQGCTTTNAIQINQPDLLVVTGQGTSVSCTGFTDGSIVVAATGGVLLAQNYQYSIDTNLVNWQDGDIFSNLAAGIYTIYAQDENGCMAETTVNVEDVDPFFIQSFTADTTMEYLDTLTISAELNDTSGVNFTWTETTLNTIVNDTTYVFEIAPANSITYQFVATNPNGCQVDSTVIILVEKPRKIGVAAAFTPNGDGINDYVFVQGDDKIAQINTLRVYSRWGELVFEGFNLKINEPTEGWNGLFRGKPMNSAVFAWYAEVEFLDGHVEVIKGDITLLR